MATATTAIVGLALCALLRKEAPAPRVPRGFAWGSIVHPAVLPIALFSLVVGICYASIITYLNPFATAQGLMSGTSWFFVAYAIAVVSMRYFLGRAQDRHGDNAVIYFGIAMFTLSFAAVAVASHDWEIILAGVFMGLGYGTLIPACQTIAARLSGGRLGSAISTMFLTLDLGIGAAPLLLGGIISSTGYTAMYLVAAALSAVSAALYYFVHGRRPESSRHFVQVVSE